jgi:molecular chaperone GrpE
MTRQGLLRVFDRHGVSQIPAEYGGTFDPNEHEAIASMSVTEAAAVERTDKGRVAVAGSVAVVAQEGYRLNDRVLRPARVVVVEATDGESQVEHSEGSDGWKDSTSMRAHWVSGWSA